MWIDKAVPTYYIFIPEICLPSKGIQKRLPCEDGSFRFKNLREFHYVTEPVLTHTTAVDSGHVSSSLSSVTPPSRMCLPQKESAHCLQRLTGPRKKGAYNCGTPCNPKFFFSIVCGKSSIPLFILFFLGGSSSFVCRKKIIYLHLYLFWTWGQESFSPAPKDPHFPCVTL